MVQITGILVPDGAVFWFLNDWNDRDQQHFVADMAAREVTVLEFSRLLFCTEPGADLGREKFSA
jgi:hypothetical protein